MADDLAAGILLSAGYVGMAVGTVSSGCVADRIGRKKTLILMLVIMVSVTAACKFAADTSTTALFRFLAGIGLGGSLPKPEVYMLNMFLESLGIASSILLRQSRCMERFCR